MAGGEPTATDTAWVYVGDPEPLGADASWPGEGDFEERARRHVAASEVVVVADDRAGDRGHSVEDRQR